MLMTAPPYLFIGLSDINLLPAERGTAFSTDNPAAEYIPVLINGPVFSTLSLPAVFIKLPHRFCFFSGDDCLMIILNQILRQLSTVTPFYKWNPFGCIGLLLKQVTLINGILQNSLDYTVLPAF